MTNFYVYVDWTTENVTRPFYVGKGNLERVCDLVRNDHHTYIAEKHGQRREIVFETNDEGEAYDVERELVAKHNTFLGFGANETTGGDNVANKCEITVKQMHEGSVKRIFKSLRELAKHYNIKPATVSNALAGRCVMPLCMRGYEWIPSRQVSFTCEHGNSMQVLEIDQTTGETRVHASITAALKVLKLSYRRLSSALRNVGFAREQLREKTNKVWRFKHEHHINAKQMTAHDTSAPSHARPVILSKDGVDLTFPSIKRAAQSLDISEGAVSFALYNDGVLGEHMCRFLHAYDKQPLKRKTS